MVIQGVIWGISLSFMIGPLLFSIIEAGIAQGFRAGLAVAIGIWLSDVLYVAAVMSGVEILSGLTALPGFRLWSGIIGGCLLLAFGMGSLLKAHKKAQLGYHSHGGKANTYSWMEYCLRGFLVNTVNPFTVFFWLSIVGAVVIPNGWNYYQTLWFFGSMLGTLVITDTLKAYAARQIRRFLTPQHILWVQRGIGILLLIFGVVLIVRVL